MALNLRLGWKFQSMVRGTLKYSNILNTKYSNTLNTKSFSDVNTNDADWFKALTSSPQSKWFDKWNNIPDPEFIYILLGNNETDYKSIFEKDLDQQTKRKAINELIISFKQTDIFIPQDLNEKEWEMVEKTESMSHLKNTLRHNILNFVQLIFIV